MAGVGMNRDNVVVAIDGPAGSGKSTVARAVASELGYLFLDTGAAYRSLAWFVDAAGGDAGSRADVLRALESFTFDISLDTGRQVVTVGETDVTGLIRTEQISQLASKVAVVPEVRRAVNERFRELIATASPGIVAEGRDVTTVIAPDADVRILLTARPEVRAARRARDVGEDAAKVEASIRERDARDSQTNDLERPAEGVRVVDTSDLTLPQVVAEVVNVVRGRSPK